MYIRNVIQRIYSFFLNANLYALITIPFFGGWAILLMTLVIWPEGFNNTHIQDLWFSLGFFCVSLSGIPIIIRKESIFRGRATGIAAVIQGVIILCAGLALASITIFIWNR
jgi:hypothetical protein